MHKNLIFDPMQMLGYIPMHFPDFLVMDASGAVCDLCQFIQIAQRLEETSHLFPELRRRQLIRAKALDQKPQICFLKQSAFLDLLLEPGKFLIR